MNEEEKLVDLRRLLRDLGKAVVAFSGGVDSSFLLRIAYEELRQDVIAVINVSESFSSLERENAIALAEQIGVPHQIVHSREMEDDCFLSNPPDRCYYCKKAMLSEVSKAARQFGTENILDGTNADDLKAYRPGRKAGREMGVRSPLAEIGFSKSEIRSLSKALGLPTADKPQMACLVSRIPYNERITRKKLDMVEKAESYLISLGVKQLRVRGHGDLARIEVMPVDFSLVMSKREEIVNRFRQIGFVYITLDIQGFRSGSMDEVL